ncbi:immunity 49 family protein [Streptomyces sp. C11-1]|uniref:Immunity 49 family protein n=1 Tax=Streptomyces durocortorensis TaxID=2811104 RepID=A0ABY9W0E2_9ACTN|nr:immunity 49 family protein [Streptomyces durocortorensis]WNF28521.1 immunity 49 family protein [Streptomyces durocortorensis]
MTHDNDNATAPASAPDAHLPMLTTAQADRLRCLVADDLSARDGAHPRVDGATAVRERSTHALTTLAHRCRAAAPELWPTVIAEHFTSLDTVSQGGESAEELLSRTVLRLLPTEALAADERAGFRYAWQPADHLMTVLALDAPDTVRMLTDADVERAGLDALKAAGRANLLAEPVEHEEIRTPSGALLHSVHGDSHFVASKALVLADLARALTGRDLPEAGALVVVPTRHLLAFHPIVDATAVGAVNDLGMYALGAYEDGPGSLNPLLYWWRRDELVCLTSFDEQTRAMRVVPPPELMDLMRSLHAEQPAAAATPSAGELHAELRGLTDKLPQDPAGLPEAFDAAVAHAHARCADDPDAAELETWEAWVLAMQLGDALFATSVAREGEVACRVGDRVIALPATGPSPHANGRTWLTAFWFALVCREGDRLSRLAHVPLNDLRQADPSQDAYLFHWIETLQTYWLGQSLDDVVQKLIATMETSDPKVATRTAPDLLNLIDHQPAALFHRLITRNHGAFAETLTESVTHHDRYWTASPDPRAHVALGPLALACLAHDGDFPVDATLPRLPKHLISRAWCGEFPT